MRRRMGWTRALLFLGGLAGCGGDDDGAECSSFTACGGDPVGGWAYVDQCLTLDFELPGCPGATLDDSAVTVSGTITFEDGGTMTASTAVSGDLALVFPQSCLPEGESCEDGSDVDFTCSSSGSTCRCSAPVEAMGSGTGTWEVAGSSITLAQAGDEPQTFEFCIDGD